MSSCYYMSNWEDIILKSSNTEDNIKLMKLIILSIELNQKPFYLTGFNYFNVSLATVVTVSSNLYQKFDNLDNQNSFRYYKGPAHISPFYMLSDKNKRNKKYINEPKRRPQIYCQDFRLKIIF